MSTEELLDTIRRYAAEHYPAAPAVRVRIDLAGDETIRLPIPCGPGARPAADESPRPTRVERTILRAVAGLDADEPTGPEVAAAAKLPYEPELRKTLSAMRKKGWLGGRERDQGYPITPIGLALIQADAEVRP